MKAIGMIRVITVVGLLLPALHAWSQPEEDRDITLRLLDETEGEEQVMRELALPAEASEQGRISSAHGLATANAARQRSGEAEGTADDEAIDTSGDDEDVAVSDDEESVEHAVIELPAEASEQARESAAFGLDTANAAREGGRAFGQERADEARERVAERREEARQQAGQERAAEARERASERGGPEQGQGRPEVIPGPPAGVPARPRN